MGGEERMKRGREERGKGGGRGQGENFQTVAPAKRSPHL